MAGRRDRGAGGRPPLIEGETLRRATVTLPAAYLEWARTEGGGNVSEGLRRLLEDLDGRWGAERLAGERRRTGGQAAATSSPARGRSGSPGSGPGT